MADVYPGDRGFFKCTYGPSKSQGHPFKCRIWYSRFGPLVAHYRRYHRKSFMWRNLLEETGGTEATIGRVVRGRIVPVDDPDLTRVFNR